MKIKRALCFAGFWVILALAMASPSKTFLNQQVKESYQKADLEDSARVAKETADAMYVHLVEARSRIRELEGEVKRLKEKEQQ